MIRRAALMSCVAMAIGSTAAATDMDGDAERGRDVFKKCAACHMVGPDARKKVGPPLNNIVSSNAGAADGFRYSKALRTAAQGGLLWTPEELDAFLAEPKGYLPKTKMSFRGLRKAQDRADVVAYLSTFSEGRDTGAVDAGFTVAPEILALEGDVEYGAYLGSECITCHQTNGANDGIPAITGWEITAFVTAMHAYRGKHRKNPVMQMVSGRLTDEEIAALAAYFKDLKN